MCRWVDSGSWASEKLKTSRRFVAFTSDPTAAGAPASLSISTGPATDEDGTSTRAREDVTS
jgi:hypothetical protein